MNPHSSPADIARSGSDARSLRLPLSSSWKSAASNDSALGDGSLPSSPLAATGSRPDTAVFGSRSGYVSPAATTHSRGWGAPLPAPRGGGRSYDPTRSNPSTTTDDDVLTHGNGHGSGRLSATSAGSYSGRASATSHHAGFGGGRGSNARHHSQQDTQQSLLGHGSDRNATQPNSSSNNKLSREQLEEYSQRAEEVARASRNREQNAELPGNPLRYTWVISYTHRKPGAKINDYNDTISKLVSMRTVEEFWGAYSRLKRPNDLLPITEYHFFKAGIQPIWEDNIHGGKWIIRLKKGISSRLWENLLLALIGEQFDVGDEICGAVISIRQSEDILSLWTLHSDSAKDTFEEDDEATRSEEIFRNKAIIFKIRDTLRHVLNLPDGCVMQYKAHKAAVVDHSSFRNTETFK